MSGRRWPVFAWRHQQGSWAARLLSDEVDISGVGAEPAIAVATVERAAARAVRALDWEPGDPPEEPRLLEIAVALRGEHLARGRSWAARDAIRLLLPVAVCEDSRGRIAFVPTVGVAVRLVAGDELKEQVVQVLRRHFAGDEPAAIAAHLPPASHELDWATVPEPRRRSAEQRRSLGALAVVADPVPLGGEHRVWQREELVASVSQALGRGCLALVGEPGCGKTAVLLAAARAAERRLRADRRSAPGEAGELASLPPRFWRTGAQRLVAGMKYLGQWQERLEEVIRHLAAIDGVMMVEALADLMAVGGEDEADSLAAFLAPFLRQGDLRLIGECSPQELDTIRRRLPAFADAFAVVSVPPLGRMEALAVVRQAAEVAARRHGLPIDPGVAGEVDALFRRHLGDAGFPGPAVRFLERLGEEAARAGAAALSRADAVAAFVRHSGLPERVLRDEVPLPRVEVVARLATRVVGQEAAVAAAADVVLAVKAGLCDPQRPLASLLFAGPTGVGKTQLARALAGELFAGLDGEAGLIRLDLSEYAGPDAPERLLGTGREPSALVRRLRQQPSALLLLDEIEKADAVVFDLLLGALDEGRFSDRFGRVIGLRSTVVVMTSNLGAEARPLRGFGGAEADGEAGTAAVERALAEHFRPEFLARIDQVVVFTPLGTAMVRRICELELRALAEREGLRERGMTLVWDEAVVDELARRGHDPALGARPLQRAINDLVAAPLARFLISPAAATTRALRLSWRDGGVIVVGE